MLNYREYLLTCLSEECAEIQQLVGKSLRFGLDSYHPQDENQVQNHIKLIQELNDLFAIVQMLDGNGVFGDHVVWNDEMVQAKVRKVKHFMKISKELGKMNESYPISKYSEKTGWIFIKDFEGTYEEALQEASKLQYEDSSFIYRIWDER
jgi:hypothetical protein